MVPILPKIPAARQRCPDCGGLTTTLYCDGCAPSANPTIENSPLYSLSHGKRRNGEPMAVFLSTHEGEERHGKLPPGARRGRHVARPSVPGPNLAK